MAAPGVWELFTGYFEPLLLLSLAIYYYLVILVQSLIHLNFNHPQISSDAFARFWLALSGDPSPPSDALTTILSSATGTVLELGPGSGSQVKNLRNPSIGAIYGAEPCEGLHDALRRSAADAGLAENYHILGCGGEMGSLVPTLAKTGLLKDGETSEIFDSIVCVRVLCSVPKPQETVKGLYALLKPGGKFIMYEHVSNPGGKKGSALLRVLQEVYMLMGWRIFLGGCHLNRDTAGIVKKAGGSEGWESMKMEMQSEWSTIPYAVGVLVKKAV